MSAAFARAPAPSWRDSIKVHPAADVFPMMSPDEIQALADDIKKNGLLEMVAVLADGDYFELLEGRNRLSALELNGINAVDPTGKPDWRYCKRVGDDPGFNPYAYVISANIHRRHLTLQQKRELIAKLLKADPTQSDRTIATAVHTSPTTVGTVRREREQAGDVSKLDTRTDTKGRKQPATKSKPRPPAKSPQTRDTAIVGLCGLLRQRPADTLEDLVRILRDQLGIKDLPLNKRIRIARGLVEALGVSVDDLRVSGEGVS